MSSRRTLILIGALVAGAIAAVLIFQYVGGIEEQAQGEAQLVDVVIAKAPIAKGAAANDLIATKAIDIGQRRQVDLPANRVNRPEEIKGQIAQIPIEPGTIITASMFQSDGALTNSVSTALKPGMVAVTVSSDQTKSVAGLITQGDYVNLTLIGDCTMGPDGKLQVSNGDGAAAGGDVGAAGGGGAVPTVSCAVPIYQKVRIMGIGRSLGTAASTPVATPGQEATATTVAPTSDLITFEVPPEAAQVISSVNGNIYMTLVRKDYVPREIPITPYGVPATPGSLTPYGGDPEATAGN